MLPLMLEELNETEDGRRLIKVVLSDLLGKLAVTPAVYLQRGDELDELLGVCVEDIYGLGLAVDELHAAVLTGGGIRGALSGLLLDDEDRRDLAVIVKPFVMEALCASIAA